MTKSLNQILNQLKEHFSSMTQEEIEKEWGSGCEIHFTTKG